MGESLKEVGEEDASSKGKNLKGGETKIARVMGDA
jgi:hypothetical protein